MADRFENEGLSRQKKPQSSGIKNKRSTREVLSLTAKPCELLDWFLLCLICALDSEQEKIYGYVECFRSNLFFYTKNTNLTSSYPPLSTHQTEPLCLRMRLKLIFRHQNH